MSSSIAIEDAESLSSPSPSENKASLLRACSVLGLATLFYFYENLLNVAPGAMKPELMMAFVNDASQFGTLSAFFLYAYGLTQIPAGLLMDRYGPRKLLTLACAFCTLGTLLFSLAESLSQAKIGRFMIGIGAGFALVSCLKLAIGWFHPKRFAFLTGASVTVGFLGSSIGLAGVSHAVAAWGWRSTLQLAFAFGTILTILVWMIVRDRAPISEEGPTVIAEASSTNLSLKESLLLVIKNKQTWIASSYAALMFVPTLAFALWAIPFLGEAHGYDRDAAGQMASLIFIGWATAAPFYGWVSDYFGKRNLPMYIAALATLGICLAIIFLKDTTPFIMGSLMFLLGIFSSNFILAFAVVREINQPEVSGTAIGVINTLNTLCGALVQPIIGKILDVAGNPTISATGEKIFGLADYQTAFMSLPICIVVAMIMLFGLKETHCKQLG